MMSAREEEAVRRVERAIALLPATISLYFHGDTASVMRCDETGMAPDPADLEARTDANIGSIETPRCEAGDF